MGTDFKFKVFGRDYTPQQISAFILQKIKQYHAPKKLSKDEIERMVTDAEKFAAQDAKKREEVELINRADNLVYSTEKSLRDYGDKISQKERADIENAVNDLKQAVKDKHLDRIKKAMDQLTQASHKLAEAIYRQSSQKPEPEKPKPEDRVKERVVDTEFEETGGRP